MSALELLGEWLGTLASSNNAPGGPAPATGPGAGPGLAGGAGGGGNGGRGGSGGRGGGNGGGGNGGGGGGDGGGGPGGPNGPSDDGPPTIGDLWDSGKDAIKELIGIGDEVADIATSDNRTADQETAWGAGGKDGGDLVLENVPGVDKVTEANSYGQTAYEGIKNVKKYNKRRHDILEAISNSRDQNPDYGGDGSDD